MSVIGFDFDKTLSTSERDGDVCVPIQENVEYAKRLQQAGHRIHVITARLDASWVQDLLHFWGLDVEDVHSPEQYVCFEYPAYFKAAVLRHIGADYMVGDDEKIDGAAAAMADAVWLPV